MMKYSNFLVYTSCFKGLLNLRLVDRSRPELKSHLWPMGNMDGSVFSIVASKLLIQVKQSTVHHTFPCDGNGGLKLVVVSVSRAL